MQNLISVKIKEDKIMSKNATVKNPMKVITGENTRWSYANVWEPKSINGGTPKYSVSLIIPKSDTKTSRLPSKLPTSRASPSSRATPRVCRLWQPLRRLSVTATQNARMIRPMPTPTSSTRTPRRHPASWMRISILCSPVRRSTPVCMAAPASPCMLSTPTATVASPAA